MLKCCECVLDYTISMNDRVYSFEKSDKFNLQFYLKFIYLINMSKDALYNISSKESIFPSLSPSRD